MKYGAVVAEAKKSAARIGQGTTLSIQLNTWFLDTDEFLRGDVVGGLFVEIGDKAGRAQHTTT
ncbi:hypothetical protein D3C87_2180270 [compost metagenome]